MKAEKKVRARNTGKLALEVKTGDGGWDACATSPLFASSADAWGWVKKNAKTAFAPGTHKLRTARVYEDNEITVAKVEQTVVTFNQGTLPLEGATEEP